MFSGRRFFCALLPFPEAKTALIRAVYRSDSRLAKAARESGPVYGKINHTQRCLKLLEFQQFVVNCGHQEGLRKVQSFCPTFWVKKKVSYAIVSPHLNGNQRDQLSSSRRSS